MQSNQEILHKSQTIVRGKLIGNTSLVFLNYGYNVLTKT